MYSPSCKEHKNMYANLLKRIDKTPFYTIFTFAGDQYIAWISSEMYLQTIDVSWDGYDKIYSNCIRVPTQF